MIVADWLADGRDYGVSDDSWVPAGAFRFHCTFSHLAYDDPIVFPDQPGASHLHMFFGADLVDGFTSWESLVTEGGGSCPGGPLNRTGYWMPAVFDGQGRVVVPNSFELYYKGENTSGSHDERVAQIQAIQPYPDGLRMIAGAPDQGVWGWSCEGSSSSSSTIPECPDGERLTAWVRFPYCWDGTNLDSVDHRSHMSYGTDNTWGSCPSSHPVHLPEITEFAHWDDASGTSDWFAASDMGAPPGSTFHADWFGGWHPEIQDRWLSDCIHGMRGTSNATLCERLNPPFSDDPLDMLAPVPSYSGPHLIVGWTPMSGG